MKKWGTIGVVICGIGMLPMMWRAVQADTPSVVINELAWAGSSQSSSDEWIELRNLTSEPVAIGNWQLTKNTGEESLMVTIPIDATIPADGYFLVSNFDASNSAISVEPNLVETAITLSNSQLQIKLYAGDWNVPENLMDSAGDGGIPPAGNNTTKASMERDDNLTGWHTAVAGVNFDDGVSDLGTPLAKNSAIVEPPTLASVVPATAEQDGRLEIESIIGTGFSIDPPPTLQIRMGDDLIAADNIQVANPTLIDAGEFSLNDAEVGKWDLILTNPDGQTATLPEAVEVVAKPPEYDMTTTVRLNEIYPQPNTTSNDEFIELYNYGDAVVDLEGWVLDDIRNGGSSPLNLTGRRIMAKQYLTIYKPESKLTLNDSGDDVYLLQPNGFELDRTSFEAAPRGQTWARFDDGWKWTDAPTANGKNVLSEPEAEPVEVTPIDEPEDDIIPPTYDAGAMLITELLPNPDDTDEFIELYNATLRPIDLTGWSLQDASKRKYKIDNFTISIQTADGLVIQAGQYVAITQTMSNIALNNSGGETVKLLDPTGKVITFVSYPDKAPTDAAYALVDGLWTWTPIPTPAQVNVLALDEADEPPPAVEVVLGDTLPVTGNHVKHWWGVGLVGVALGAVVCLRYVYRRHEKFG